MQINKEDNKSNKRTMILSVIFIFLVIDIIVLLLFLLNYFNKGIAVESSSSVEEPSTSEAISSSVESSSTSEYDPYIDVTISNIKKYIKEVEEESLFTSFATKDIYSINTYTESESTHIVYGFTINEETDKYIRFDIDLNKELDMEEVVSLIHDDGITIEMFVEQNIYVMVSEDASSKDTFKEVCPGNYTHHTCYKDEYDTYYMSGIGHRDDAYISVDLLSFDKDTYDIDNTDTSIKQSNDINKRYYQLLEAL